MKVTEIQNAVIGVVQLPQAPGGKKFRLTIQDRDSKEVVWVDLTQEITDAVVSKLSGITIAKSMPH